MTISPVRSSMNLDSSQYYYIELNSKKLPVAPTLVYLATPFTEARVLEKTPVQLRLYIGLYATGSACSDGNEFTNDDV
ncbi:MAG: hypothetical protein IPH94_19165 [Saprospiraceae bacterium]|nr:hypothetical protein [Saprospiraceae bacterium]